MASRRAGDRRTGVDAAARLSVGIVLANHFTLTAFSAFVDTLRLAADEGDLSRPILCRWTVMGAGGKSTRASCGIEVAAQATLMDPRGFDYVAVVGGLLHKGPQVDDETEAWLRQAAAAGVPLIGLCTGTFVLARAGLLKGRRCCVSWYHHRDMLEAFADVEPVSDRLYLLDGDRITCCGGAGAADLAAALVERHVGRSQARKSLNVLLFDSPRGESAGQPLPAFLPAGVGERVRRAAALMEQNLADPLPIARIAERLQVSERQLDRLFRDEVGQGPAGTYRRMRLDYARWLLLHSGRSMAEIATLAGFADGAHFSREFRRQFGETPTAARAREGSHEPEASRSDLPPDRRLYGA